MAQLLSKAKDGKAHISTLGLGDDGHFASLFPHMPEERKEAALDSTKYDAAPPLAVPIIA